jgi:hypothetical protein
MRTGKLLKFQRPGGDIQAYLYREGSVAKAAVYVRSAQPTLGADPVHTISGASELGVEAEVRKWVESHFPKER